MSSLEEDQILFNPDDARKLFREVGVLFEGQVKRDFQQLIAFNRAITDERHGYLVEERAEIEGELKTINSELNALGKKRSEMLAFLSGTDSFGKYKQVSNELVTLRADITTLERQRGYVHRLQELRTEIRILTEERGHLQTEIEADVDAMSADKGSKFSAIRLLFQRDRRGRARPKGAAKRGRQSAGPSRLPG
ncbi:uncharacterized protein YydD (DUF2326 family) [Bradyrhizobium sp. F1.13.1]